MKHAKRILVVLLVAAMVLSLCACGSDKSRIKKTISNFEKSCNKMDPEAMMECLEPDLVKGVKAGMGVVGFFTGASQEEMVNRLVGLLFGQTNGTDGLMKNLSLKCGDIVVKGNTATVKCTMGATVSGKETSGEATIKMIQTEDVWYIAGIDMIDTLFG